MVKIVIGNLQCRFLWLPTSYAVPLSTGKSVVKWRPVKVAKHICQFCADRNILRHYTRRSTTNNRQMCSTISRKI